MVSNIITEFLAQLRTAFTLTSAHTMQLNAVLETDGKPPPACGERFIAIHQLPSGWMPSRTLPTDSESEVLHEEFNFGVTLSYRVADVPEDRFYPTIWPAIESDAKLVLKTLVVNRWTIFENINTALAGTDNMLARPYRWLGNDGPDPVSPLWFSYADPIDSLGKPLARSRRPAGYTYRIKLGGFERIQHRATTYS